MAYSKISGSRKKGTFLTPLMLAFIDEYMIDLNATAAVTRAGYKTTYANRIGTELLRHPLVKPEIDKRMQEKRERNEVTVDFVLNKLVKIISDTEDGNPNAALRGLELLGKHLGMYKDRQEISGPDGGAIEMEQRTKESASEFVQKLKHLSDRTTNVVPIIKNKA